MLKHVSLKENVGLFQEFDERIEKVCICHKNSEGKETWIELFSADDSLILCVAPITPLHDLEVCPVMREGEPILRGTSVEIKTRVIKEEE